ncbi:MAG: MazG family protein [Clostridia bacterium]|nr:MazG family protein [Clostridia bacterium]
MERSPNSTKEELMLKDSFSFGDLCSIIEILRGKDGCPWDREQDHLSIRGNLIEETYEAVEAIDKADSDLLKEELGDVLMQIVFHAQMEKETGSFDIGDVINGTCRKLIDRHPHVFSSEGKVDSEEALKNWEKAKNIEKQRKTLSSSLESIPPSLPALMRASKMYRKLISSSDARMTDTGDILPDAFEKINALSKISADSSAREREELIGNLLFDITRLSCILGTDSEKALNDVLEDKIRTVRKSEGLG